MPLALVVEDNPLNLELMEEMLGVLGFKVLKAENAEEAAQVLQHALPEIIFLDIQLPGMDGISFARKLREANKALPPLIAVTAHTMPGDAEKILESGFDHYLAKPVNLKSLQYIIEQLGTAGA